MTALLLALALVVQSPDSDTRALLGLYDPADTTDWGPIRAAQLHAGSQLALFMLATNVVGGALMHQNAVGPPR